MIIFQWETSDLVFEKRERWGELQEWAPNLQKTYENSGFLTNRRTDSNLLSVSWIQIQNHCFRKDTELKFEEEIQHFKILLRRCLVKCLIRLFPP
jgi:DNA topoisomerase IA